MKKYLWILVGALLMLGIFAADYARAASPVTLPVNGGTGTSTKPLLGQVLVGLSNGTYGPQATSTLGISGSNYFTNSGALTYLSTGTNLGIGTTVPAERLDVNGYINTDATSGYKQGDLLLLTASNVTSSLFLGFNTGVSSLSSAVQNLFMGTYAGYSNTTGQNNTFVGYQAGFTNTVGTSNFYMGNIAGLYQTNSNYNVAIGGNAMTGASGQAQSTNGNNVAIGYQALTSRSTGYFNTAVGGASTGYKITSGAANTVIGSNAGQSMTTGNFLVAVGYLALSSATGADNIGIGSQAGSNLTSGTKNIIIGDTVNAPNPTASNQLNIGNIIFGTGVSGTGSTISGNIGIGTTSPAALLDLFSTASTTLRIDSTSTTTGGQILMKDATGTGYTCIYSQAGAVFSKVAATKTTC